MGNANDFKLNEEQKQATEHLGGLLLEAGAGSGKTKVIMEHFFYKVQVFLGQLDLDIKNNKEKLKLNLKGFLNRIILITFTKNATQELKIRIKLRCDENYLLDAEIWNEVLPQLNISTIHGLLKNLISEGLIPSVSSDVDVTNDWEYERIISRLFENYFKENKEKDSIEKLLITFKNGNNISTFLSNIIKSPLVRDAWVNNQAKDKKLIFDNFFEGIEEIYSFNDLFNFDMIDQSLDVLKKGAFSDMLKIFKDEIIRNDFKKFDFESLTFLFEFFQGKRKPVMPKANLDSDVINYLEKFRSIKDFVNRVHEDLSLFNENSEIFFEMTSLIRTLVIDIEKEYRKLGKMTFNDMEYYVYEGLKDEATRRYLNGIIDYIIIDEYQDTSTIQYEIIKKLISEDFSKLFAVGDKKQAIYGFRGGEISVFQDTEKRISNRLELKNNYRSSKKIVEFNNEFFKRIFSKNLPKTKYFKNVNFLTQSSPADDVLGNGVVLWDLEVDKTKANEYDVNLLESIAVLEGIKRTLKSRENESIVVIASFYSSLRIIFDLLKKEKISFVADFKIKYLESPIFIILFELLSYQLANKTTDTDLKNLTVKIEELFKVLIKDENFNLDFKSLKLFYNHLKITGVSGSFLYFLRENALSINFSSNELEEIDNICKFCFDDPEKILLFLSDVKDQGYKVDYQFGENPVVRLMVIHGSKGLEFDHLFFVGGYESESRRGRGSSYFSVPTAIEWGINYSDKNLKSPDFLLQKDINEIKDGLERDRLNYVMLTRAKKTLNFVMIYPFIKEPKNKLMEELFNFSSGQNQFERNEIDLSLISPYLNVDHGGDFNQLPLYFYDNLGILRVVTKDQNTSSPLILSELSVTSLATVIDCPRKYYLYNIVKLRDDELTILNDLSGKKELKLEFDGDNVSSKKRGTLIHDYLSKIIEDKISPKDLIPENADVVMKVWNEISKLKENYTFQSEFNMKFDLFGQMVTGRPDLILYPKNKEDKKSNVEIWDFKTGKKDDLKEDSYWFQLLCYAFGLFSLGLVNPHSKIKLKLLYVDGFGNFERNISYNEARENVRSILLKTSDLSTVNESFCHFCEYKNVCH